MTPSNAVILSAQRACAALSVVRAHVIAAFSNLGGKIFDRNHKTIFEFGRLGVDVRRKILTVASR
jgi:peptidoglycan/LPS O-acetylase OafA/YrhL